VPKVASERAWRSPTKRHRGAKEDVLRRLLLRVGQGEDGESGRGSPARALLATSGYQLSDASKISQHFEASNGDKVSGWAFFRTENYASCAAANDDNIDDRAYDDKGQVVITSASGTTVATPFEQSVRTVDPPESGGNSGWRYWEHTFSGLTGTEQFRIEARVQNNAWLNGGVSRIGLDDVKTSTGGGPDTTPPETFMTSGPCGITPSTSATFEFHSNEQGSTFKCQLSKDYVVVQPWEDCTLPKSYSNLSRDTQWRTSYRFEVKATDLAGNVEPTPAGHQWVIDADTTAPTLISPVPKADAKGVAPQPTSRPPSQRPWIAIL